MDSVGAISLDLIIQSKMEAQIEGAAKAAEIAAVKSFSAATKSAEKALDVGDAAAKGVEKSMQAAIAAVDKSIDDVGERAKKTLEKTVGSANTPKKKSAPAKSVGGYDQEAMAWIDEYEKKLSEAAQKTQKTKDVTGEIGESFQAATKPLDLLNQRLSNLKLQMQSAQEQHERLSAQFSKLTDADMTGTMATKLGDAITSNESKILSLQDSIDRTKDKISNIVAPQKVAQKAQQASDKTKGIFSKLGDGIKGVFSKAGSKIQSGAGKIGSKVHNSAAKSLNKLKSSVNRVTRGISSAFRSVFLMAGVYAAFKGLRSLISKAADQNEEFKRSLNTVKANLMAAFTPIMTAIMPMLNSLMSVMSVATRKVAEFVSNVFGTTYSKSMAAAKGIETAAKKAKKATSGLDELNILSSGEADSGIDYNNIDTTTSEQAVGKMAQLKEQASQFFSKIGKLASAAITKISGYAPLVVAAAVTLISSFINGLQANFPAIAAAGLLAVTTLCEGMKDILPQLGPLAADIVITLVTGLITIAGALIPAGIEMLRNFMDGIAQKLPDLIPLAVEAVEKITQSIRDNLPSLIASGFSILLSLMEGISQTIPSLANTALAIVLELITGLTENGPAIITTGIETLCKLIDGIANALPLLLPAAMECILTLVMGLIDNLDKVFDSAINLIMALVDGILNALPLLVEQAPVIIQKLVDGIVNAIPKLIDAAVTIIEKLVDYVINNLGDLILMGPKIMISIATGLIKAIPELIKAVPKMIKALIDKILNTDWIQVGKDILSQILNGIGNIADAVKNGVSGAWNSVKSGASSAWNWVKDKVPFFAEGGIVRQPTLAMIGEAGAEAVVPLEQNTGGLDKLADLLSRRLPQQNNGGGNASRQPIILQTVLNNRVIAESVIDGVWSIVDETGRNPLPV